MRDGDGASPANPPSTPYVPRWPPRSPAETPVTGSTPPVCQSLTWSEHSPGEFPIEWALSGLNCFGSASEQISADFAAVRHTSVKRPLPGQLIPDHPHLAKTLDVGQVFPPL
jgi:hypothetical protein